MPITRGHKHLPARLYKFTERRFAEDLVLGRSIRIGTIYEFRNQEEHGLQKGDPDEGKIFIGKGSFAVGRDASPGLYRFFKDRGHIFENSTISSGPGQPGIELGEPDGNIVCLSLDADKGTRDSLDPKYDACVEIGNPAAFINSLAAAVYDRFKRFGRMTCYARAVEYRSRISSHLANEFPDGEGWCTKDTSFAVQKEFRVIFDHERRPIEPFIVGFDPSGCNMKLI